MKASEASEVELELLQPVQKGHDHGALSTKHDHSLLHHLFCCVGAGLLLLALFFSRHPTSSPLEEAANSSAYSTVMSSSNVDALVSGRIIGDVLDPFTPSLELKVAYGQKVVSDGTELTPAESSSVPAVEIAGKAENGDLYTLVMTDPDAPDPKNPSKREWLHWIVKDIPGGTGAAAGKEVVAYMGPSPPVGVHRYAFIVYKQAAPLDVEMPASRAKFNTRKFAQDHLLGSPVAAVYFTSQP